MSLLHLLPLWSACYQNILPGKSDGDCCYGMQMLLPAVVFSAILPFVSHVVSPGVFPSVLSLASRRFPTVRFRLISF